VDPRQRHRRETRRVRRCACHASQARPSCDAVRAAHGRGDVSAWFYEAGFGGKTACAIVSASGLEACRALGRAARLLVDTGPKRARCSRSVINEGFLADRDIRYLESSRRSNAPRLKHHRRTALLRGDGSSSRRAVALYATTFESACGGSTPPGAIRKSPQTQPSCCQRGRYSNAPMSGAPPRRRPVASAAGA
jgi:hypothetical protein